MTVATISPTVASLDPSRIRIDGDTQPRAAISEETVAEYAQCIADGATLPPVDVFFDGAEYWLADGFHRYHAVKRLGAGVEIDATIHAGTRRDAVLFSVGANTEHGLRRTNADKRKAVVTLLRDGEWGKWSDREIARRCAVNHVTVGDLRRSLVITNSEPRTVPTKHGTVTQMNVSNIGRTPRASAARTDLQERREMGMEGAPDSILRNRAHRSDDAFMGNLLGALQGLAIGMGGRDTSTLASNPLAPQWVSGLEEFQAQLRAFIRPIKNGGK